MGGFFICEFLRKRLFNSCCNIVTMKGVIKIIGDIGNYTLNGEEVEGVKLADVIAQVKSQPEATEFDVIINSVGGSVKAGLDIFNYLSGLPQKINTIGQGVVASIATCIFMSGTTRTVQKGTLFMIHLPSGQVGGTAEEIKDYQKNIERVESEMIDFYTKGLDLDKETVKALLEDETFLTEEQLVSFGLVTEKPESIIAKAIFSKDIDFNKKKPKMSKKTKKTGKSIIDQIAELLNGSQDEVVNKIVYDANNTEIVFPELDADAEPSVGDKATVDGQPASGEYVTADGKVHVFVEGELTEIKDEEEEEMSPEEIADALTEELKVALASLKKEKEAKETAQAELKTVKATLKQKETILNKIASMKIVDEEEEEEEEIIARKRHSRRSGGADDKKSRFGKAIAKARG